MIIINNNNKIREEEDMMMIMNGFMVVVMHYHFRISTKLRKIAVEEGERTNSHLMKESG